MLGKFIHSKAVVRPNTDTEERIRQLHLSATEYISNGKIDEAVTALSEAQELMPIVGTEYPIQQYLRFPLTLQKIGRFQEAVSEFNRLLNSSIKPYQRSSVYDKLRLAFQREGKHREAVEFGILCLAWECIALAEQDRDWSFLVEEPDRWLKQIKKSLKVIASEKESEVILAKCLSFAREPSEAAIKTLISALREQV